MFQSALTFCPLASSNLFSNNYKSHFLIISCYSSFQRCNFWHAFEIACRPLLLFRSNVLGCSRDLSLSFHLFLFNPHHCSYISLWYYANAHSFQIVKASIVKGLRLGNSVQALTGMGVFVGTAESAADPSNDSPTLAINLFYKKSAAQSSLIIWCMLRPYFSCV